MGASVIAHGDSAPVFETPEHILDFVALFVERFIVLDLDFAVLPWRDAGRNAFFDQGISEPVGIITAIRQKLFCSENPPNQDGSAFIITDLSRA